MMKRVRTAASVAAHSPSKSMTSRTLLVPLVLFGLGVYLGLYLSEPTNAIKQPIGRRKPPLPLQAVKVLNKSGNSVRVNTATAAIVVPSPTNRTTRVISVTTTSSLHSLTNPTIAANSFFFIKNPNASYKVCDILELYIEVRDKANVRKKMGGDQIWPYIHTARLKASAPVDKLIDHGNGTYTARFTLTWAGVVEPIVRLVYSAEHVAALRNIRRRAPNRSAYDGKFIANGTTEVTPCHISKVIPYIGAKHQTALSYSSESETCDFSNVKAGTHWYCLKPKKLPCSAFAEHVGDLKRGGEYSRQVIFSEEKRVLKGPDVLSNVGKAKIVKVIPQVPGRQSDPCQRLPGCTLGLPPKQPSLTAGYYYQDTWESKVCRAKPFSLPDTIECLRGKNLYFYGDSTIRQWFEYLVTHIGPTMKETNIKGGSATKVGPRYGTDAANNITLFYRHHEYPIRNSWTDVRNIKFTVNEVDSLPGGPNTVVAFTYWAHFTPTNLTYYKSRLENVKAAVERLHQRGSSPSPVFFKSANTMETTGVDLADFYAYELDQVMRALFTGVPNVTIIDVWAMTLSHRTGYLTHPVGEVIREEIKMFLNFLCGENVSLRNS